MDAMPYRFGYAMPKRGNENIAPTTNKGLHQRHKSTGNLLGTMTNANLPYKNMDAAKSYATNDSNARAKPAASHGGYLPAMKNTGVPNQAIAMGQENRNNVGSKETFLRPAQRPPKSLVPSASMHHLKVAANPPQSHAQPAQPPSHVQPFSQQYNAEKRGAPIMVYSDNQSKEKFDVQQPPLNKATRASTASKYDSQSQNGDESWVSVESKIIMRDVSQGDSMENRNQSQGSGLSAPLRADDDRTEALYLDAVEELPNEKYPVLVPHKKESRDSVLQHSSVAPTEWHSPNLDFPEEERDSAAPKNDGFQVVLQHINEAAYDEVADSQADLSDYEDADYYDDQPYTTAHSYRDNTTGGVTTAVMPPKLTKQGIAEIEAAKVIVKRKRYEESQMDEDCDISMVAEYSEEIFAYMREMEMSLLPNPHYMDIQPDIQWSMRAVLMDWVIQVHTRFTLLPETLFLAANFIDRFLSVKVVSIGKLQLVGATALLLAAKYEEINCPSVQEVVYMVDGGYTQEDVLKAERFMLSMLNFALGWPGPMSFLRRTSKADDYDSEIRTLAKYLLEVTLMDERFVATPPSYLAAGSLCLARLILKRGDWSLDHVHYSGYTWAQLRPLVLTLLDCCEIGREHHRAIFDKYTNKAFKGVSLFVEKQIMAGFKLPYHLSSSEDLFDDDTFLAPQTYAKSVPIYG